MRQSTPIFALYGLAITGLIDSTYLAYTHVTERPLMCDIIDGCNVVAASPYSIVMGIPLSFWGIAFYLAVTLATWVAHTYPRLWFSRGLMGTTVLAASMSAYFTYLQVFVIGALCIYCLASALISFLMLGCSLWYATTVQTRQGTV